MATKTVTIKTKTTPTTDRPREKMALDGDKKEGQDQQHNHNPMKLTEHNRILYPYYFGQEPRIQLENIKNIQSKTGDIFVCSYPKSGTHWIMEMVNMLVAGSTEHPTKFNFLDPMTISDQVLDSIPCPRVFQSHLRFNQLPDSFLKRKGKIVYILRNPKDVSVSLYNFVQKEGRMKYSGSWDECFQLFVSGKVAYSSWFDHVLSWEREKEKGRHPIHFVFYEDLKEDAVRELDRISKFLSLNQPNSFLKSVAESSTFTKMRNQKYLYHPFPAEVMDENYVDFLFRRVHNNCCLHVLDNGEKADNQATLVQVFDSLGVTISITLEGFFLKRYCWGLASMVFGRTKQPTGCCI